LRQGEGEPDDEGWVTIPVKKKSVEQNAANKKKINKKLEKKKRAEKVIFFLIFTFD